MIQSSGHTRAFKTCNVDPWKSRFLVRPQESKEGEPLMTMLVKATYPVFHMFIPDPGPLRNFHVCLITSVVAPIHAHLENDAPTASVEKLAVMANLGCQKLLKLIQ
jgi:hypothetical protein